MLNIASRCVVELNNLQVNHRRKYVKSILAWLGELRDTKIDMGPLFGSLTRKPYTYNTPLSLCLTLKNTPHDMLDSNNLGSKVHKSKDFVLGSR